MPGEDGGFPGERAMKTWTLGLAGLVVTMWVVLPGPGRPAAQEPSLEVIGLVQPVEIRRDRWGVNHIYAATEQDLFFAQGYAAAKDRLFQFEMWRRQATGTVAEILGPRELERDRGARLHMFRGDLDAELAHYHPRGKAIVEAFVAGINAYVAATERTPSLLPIEFAMLGIRPGRWTPAVVISRHQALTSNVTSEVSSVRAMKTIGPEALRSLQVLPGRRPGVHARPGRRRSRVPRRRARRLQRLPQSDPVPPR